MEDKTDNKQTESEPKKIEEASEGRSKIADLLRSMDPSRFPIQSDEPEEPKVGKNRHAQVRRVRKSFGDIVMS